MVASHLSTWDVRAAQLQTPALIKAPCLHVPGNISRAVNTWFCVPSTFTFPLTLPRYRVGQPGPHGITGTIQAMTRKGVGRKKKAAETGSSRGSDWPQPGTGVATGSPSQIPYVQTERLTELSVRGEHHTALPRGRLGQGDNSLSDPSCLTPRFRRDLNDLADTQTDQTHRTSG